jgi:hypothetical protein
MRWFDELGQTTLWFALDQAWNWHFDPALIAHMRLHMMEDLTMPGVVREAQRMKLTRQDKSLVRFTESVTLVVPRNINWMLQAHCPMIMWTWYERTWPRLVERELGYVPSSYDMRQARYQRWLDRAVALHAARPAQIVSLLEAAAIRLQARLCGNRDVLDHILRLELRALCAEFHVDPVTRLPVACF